jgi:purine-binding chemotaxis protein CheW
MSNQLVVFNLDAQCYALPLRAVERVIRTVEVTPLPKAPDIVLGVIDMQGSIVPVLSMRKRFGFVEPETSLSDQFLVAKTKNRKVALVVNSVRGVIERWSEEITSAKDIVSGADYVEGITRLEEDILLIHDLDRFFSTDEERQLNGLLSCAAGK